MLFLRTTHHAVLTVVTAGKPRVAVTVDCRTRRKLEFSKNIIEEDELKRLKYISKVGVEIKKKKIRKNEKNRLSFTKSEIKRQIIKKNDKVILNMLHFA